MVVASLVEAGFASPSKGMDAKPRVIAAEVKNNASVTPKDIHHDRSVQFSKPHIAGELDLLGETTSEPHWVEVKDGQLVVYPGCAPLSAPMWRLPLRHLNLQPAASGRPRGFSLSKHGETAPIATFQVGNELDYERWVKTLAAELMRQTPLEAVRFLDILGITATIPHRASPSRELEDQPHRAFSPEYHSEPECRTWLRCPSIAEEDTPDCCMRNSLSPSRQLERMYMNKGWFTSRNSDTTVVNSQQPLSLIVTKEPVKNLVRGASNGCTYEKTYKKDSVDTVDAKIVSTVKNETVNDSSDLKNNSKSAIFKQVMKDHNENLFRKHNVVRNIRLPLSNRDNTAVRSLLKAFNSPEKTLDKENSLERRLYSRASRDDPRLGRPPLPDVVKDLPPCDRRSRTRTRINDVLRIRGKSADIWQHSSETESGDEAVAGLIARCQQVDKYVPVREKRLLFESLCRRAGTRFNSSDNINEMCEPYSLSGQPRTQSLHDLSKYNNNVAVKEICRYFEQRGGSRGELAARSPSPECNPVLGSDLISTFTNRRQLHRAEKKLSRLKQNITEAEGNIWRLQDQSNKLNQSRRHMVRALRDLGRSGESWVRFTITTTTSWEKIQHPEIAERRQLSSPVSSTTSQAAEGEALPPEQHGPSLEELLEGNDYLQISFSEEELDELQRMLSEPV